MRKRITKIQSAFFVLLLLALTTSLAAAEDGPMFRRNVSSTPDQETERANMMHMTFYVPAQSSDGTLLEGVDYYDAAGTLIETRAYVKPLVAVYIDALPHEEEEEAELSVFSGATFGAHDAYAAVSLDDGTTWRRTNLSRSADLSSFFLANGQAYPGDAHNMTFAVAGDRVLVGWISKYCDGGSPAYTWVDETTGEEIYPDIWGVAGSQGSVDYTLQGFPEVGEIPYSCVWAARGRLLPLDDTPEDGPYDIVWTHAERLTSGRRDANRLEMAGDSAAGFMMVWQEDPEGLRPGQGLGPGEGWSGAVVNAQTDLWYSYISIADFDMVQTSDEDPTPIPIADYTGETVAKVAIPMALPVRLTDNAMCRSTNSDPYCYVDFDNVDTEGNLILPDELPTAPTAESDFCTSQVAWTTPGGSTLTLCVAEDGRVMQGRVGASRPRVNVQPYDSDGDFVYDSAWVIMGAEESKAMGEGVVTDLDGDEEIEPEDIGKNMWYYSFDMLNPSVVMQGGMLNWPAYDPETGLLFDMLEDDFGNPIYATEIARRFSHFSQPIHQIGPSGVSAVLIVKQGILNQGGPADIFLQRLQVPDDVWIECETDGDALTTERCLPAGYNPYAYENMICEDAEGNSMWAYRPDLGQEANPRYLQGLCLATGINVSSVTIDSCDNGTSGDACADAFPWDGGVSPFPKVTEWSQTPEDLADESWFNPYDVAKGHRGFIDGDFIMMMYAWAPNWQANSVGNDHYNLYIRRSFDGGETWTTTPAELGGDGTTTCENFKSADGTITTECTTYGSGEFEQARNVSQLIGNRETILDPRYTPTGGIKMLPITDMLGVGGGELPYWDDAERDPSRFFVVYETGDNTTVEFGEATPLDLFYSRATNWGDDYDLVEYYNSGTGETTLGFDWLEHDREDLSGEAANTANPGGTFYYVIWNQWQEDEYENVFDSDAIFRRLMYIDTEDADPVASILYYNPRIGGHNLGGDLTLVGSAMDGDHLGAGIVEYAWHDGEDFLTSEPHYSAPIATFSPGWHTFSFTAQDAEGNWSAARTVTVFIAETLHQTWVPMTLR